MQVTVGALAEFVGGTVQGDGTVPISDARAISEAGPGHITFVEDQRYAKLLVESHASAAVVGQHFQGGDCPLIRASNPLEAFVKIFEHFRPTKRQCNTGVHPQSVIASTARIGADASIGPYVTIGEDVAIGDRCRIMPGTYVADGCRIGDDVTLHGNVVLYAETTLGNRVIVHAGSVIGADGFGYRPGRAGHVKMPQFGHVEIGDDVEIGANTTIDRGTFHKTRIGDGTKIDNLVQVAHNCQIGRHNLLVSQVGIAGSSRTGDYVIVAGQAGVKEHITIGEKAIVEAMAGVMDDIPAGETWVGAPAGPARVQFRIMSMWKKLPELRDQVATLIKQVEDLQNRVGPRRQSA